MTKKIAWAFLWITV